MKAKGRCMPQISAEPVVTVILPAFNAESFLSEAVSSALGQTLSDIEVIIVDDASTDGTLKIARSFAKADPRVRVLENSSRLGPGGGRNKALDHARGRWIALLDADDRFAPDRLMILTTEAERRGCDFFADNLMMHDLENGCDSLAFPEELMARQDPLNLVDLVTLDTYPAGFTRAIGFCKPIFRRQFIEAKGLNYDLRAFRGQDFIFYFKAIEHGARFGLTPHALYEFTVGYGSHSTGLMALRHIAEANTRLVKEAKDVSPLVSAALRQREAKFNFEIFRAHVRNHAPLAALVTLFRVEPVFAYRKFKAAFARRVSRHVAFA